MNRRRGTKNTRAAAATPFKTAMTDRLHKSGTGETDDPAAGRRQPGAQVVSTWGNRRAVHIALIILLGIAVYSNTFHAPFQFDDEEFIEKNAVITNLDNFFSTSAGRDYNSRRFISFLSFAVNYRFGGYDVFGYHLVNLAVHIVNALLVYTLILLLFRIPQSRPGPPADAPAGAGLDRRRLIALFSALLFVAHPVQTQAVTYISQRMTSLATLFYLLAVVTYGAARLASLPRVQGGRVRSGPFTPAAVLCALASVASTVLAMQTKEIAFTLPVIIALFEFVFFRDGFRKKTLFLLPVLLTLAVIPVVLTGVHQPLGELLSDLSEKTRLQTDMPRWNYFLTELRVVVTYLRLLAWPAGQNLDYDYPASHSPFEAGVLFSFLLLSSLAGLGVWFLRKARREPVPPSGPAERDPGLYRVAAFGIFWFFITLSVESSVIPIVDVIFEHRVYLPSAGAFAALTSTAFIAASSGGGASRRLDGAATAAFTLAVIALAAAAFCRNTVWGDKILLHQDVVSKSPRKARAHANLGSAYGNAGLIERAMEEFRTALMLDPSDADVHNNIGIVYVERGLLDQALAEYREAVRLRPSFAEAHYNLGVAYGEKGLADLAMEEYRTAARLRPNDAAARNNLGSLYGAAGRMDEAIGEFRAAVALRPDYWEAHYNLGIALQSRGFDGQAREHLGIAARLRLANPNPGGLPGGGAGRRLGR